jgi:hypothetical protein
LPEIAEVKSRVVSVGIITKATKKFARKIDYTGVNLCRIGMACAPIATPTVWFEDTILRKTVLILSSITLMLDVYLVMGICQTMGSSLHTMMSATILDWPKITRECGCEV